MKIVFLSKENFWCDEAFYFLKIHFGNDNVKRYSTNVKYQKLPKVVTEENGNLLISFLSPWIIPKSVLEKFDIALNFHPGPPEFPGTACYNFALYENAKEYGVICHFINEKVDAGEIIETIKFPIFEKDTVESLRRRTLDYLLILFFKIMYKILLKEELKPSGEKWKRKATTRKDLENLCRIDPNMSQEEIKRRIRATYYPNMPGPFIELDNFKFYFVKKDNESFIKGD